MGLKFYLSLLYVYLTLGFARIHDCSMERFGMKRCPLYISWGIMGNVVFNMGWVLIHVCLKEVFYVLYECVSVYSLLLYGKCYSSFVPVYCCIYFPLLCLM